ncbi:MaoC family dehydratase N-terminal domain-containing protein [Variovorax sp. J31P207]|uniref:FAS1-like dehydratase domain-containing protein n=1 Tax=Variovorax sp. J31P207 TaxID=3053510 RepID=UPI0025769F9E|nr:MaoC family dehydratase N-terminal domain-containing protein [Variovorax sp. J31P207]MDM0065481.1 MaoC family dehydratase N-terminal domain-containing protein [Variovorax sp. J31P207]
MSTAYDAWIGREEERTQRILAPAVQAMAATLGLDRSPAAGDPLPPGWQWLFFNPAAPRGELGIDGHPKRGGFLPPIELPRRMWAGSRLRYLAGLPVDAEATRRSRIQKVENKVGKRGSLWFVTVEHTTTCAGRTCIVEEQDIVYREATPPGAAAPVVQRHDGEAQWGRDFEPDTTLLFRYSALTFNGHRIHYDQAYARHEEGYRDLVVHGPLTATLLQQLALEHGGGRRLAAFEFRGVSPLFVDRAFRLEGQALADGSLALWARGPDGELAMSATAAFD